jgi:hypothetical protein
MALSSPLVDHTNRWQPVLNWQAVRLTIPIQKVSKSRAVQLTIPSQSPLNWLAVRLTIPV